MAGVESCIKFAQKISPSKVNSYLVPYIKKFGDEKSWRIRYLVADKIIEIANAFGSDLTSSRLLGQYTEFLKDTESEVRTAAVSRLAEFSKLVDVTLVISKIVPCLASLSTDSF